MKANKYGTVNINGNVFKFNKTSNRPGAEAAHIEHTAQILATYKVVNHVVQLTKEFTFGEFVEYSLDVVTDWTTEGRWAYARSCRRLTAATDINKIVEYVHDLLDQEKEFGKKLLKLD